MRALLCLLALLLSACGSLPSMPARTASHALVQPQNTPLGQMVQAQRQAADTPYGSGFVLLGGADAAFASRLALVEAATQTLDLQYYAIHADPSTARLLRAIVQAAQRGVRVRILLDDFHSAGKNAQIMRMAFVPGIEMRMFNPLTGPRGSTVIRALTTLTDFQRAQQRMHNKLFIADNSIGIAGGAIWAMPTLMRWTATTSLIWTSWRPARSCASCLPALTATGTMPGPTRSAP